MDVGKPAPEIYPTKANLGALKKEKRSIEKEYRKLDPTDKQAIAVLTKLGAVNSIPTIKYVEIFEKILEVLQGVKSDATITVFTSKSRTLDDLNSLFQPSFPQGMRRLKQASLFPRFCITQKSVFLFY